MKTEQGHGGGEVAPRLTAVELLADIRDLLRADRTTDMPSDVTESRDHQITAAAGDLYIDLDVQFGYVYIPNCPRDVTIYAGTRGALIGSFKAGAFVSFRIARQVGLTIAYAAGIAAGYLTVMTSARPLEIDSGQVLVNPGTAANSLGKAEDAAHASGDVGVMALGVRNETSTILADIALDYTPVGVGRYGNVNVTHHSSSALSDASSVQVVSWLNNAITASLFGVVPMLSNGTTRDLQRNNVEATALASAARTATTASPDITNYNARGVVVFLNISAASGTGGLTLRIEGKDGGASGTYMLLNAAPTAVVATGQYAYILYPGDGAAAVGHIAQGTNHPLPRTWRVTVTHGDGSSYTYSVGYANIL